MQSLVLSVFLVLSGFVGVPQDDKASPKAAEKTSAPEASKRVTVESMAKPAHEAIRRGMTYLVKTQSEDGGWGSHDPVVIDNAQLGFGMTNFGSHDGVRIACTAICAKAILLYPARTKDDEASLNRAIEHILSHAKLAYDPGNAFNVWGYGFNLDFLTTLYEHPYGKPYRERIQETMKVVIDGLKKMQTAEGGWAYYTSVMMEGSSISFTTASILLGLMKARDLGFEVPEGLINDAGNIVKSMILPNKHFIYGTYLKYNGNHHLETLTSGGRTQVCGLSQHRFDGSFTRADLMDRSQDYFRFVDYVEKIANKRIIPHRDAPQNLSGYFLYYGCYYAAEVLTVLGKDAKEENWEHLTKLILRNQETEGSWWDTICYDYGDKWGTGFAILVLEHSLAAHGILESKIADVKFSPAGQGQ